MSRIIWQYVVRRPSDLRNLLCKIPRIKTFCTFFGVMQINLLFSKVRWAIWSIFDIVKSLIERDLISSQMALRTYGNLFWDVILNTTTCVFHSKFLNTSLFCNVVFFVIFMKILKYMQLSMLNPMFKNFPQNPGQK